MLIRRIHCEEQFLRHSAAELRYHLRGHDRSVRKAAAERLVNKALILLRIGSAQVKNAPDILRALSTLPEPLRLCLTLHYSEGYAINEIARMLRVPAGTVKSRLSRARAALRAQLHDE